MGESLKDRCIREQGPFRKARVMAKYRQAEARLAFVVRSELTSDVFHFEPSDKHKMIRMEAL